MELRLSIIIPFYNVERFISECLDSVFDQDIPLSEYEVICVNDGSPDHSRDIVLQYMERFPNLHLIEHEKNKKLGAARNTGRTIAKGEYIWNVDSDDKIVPNCLSEMLKTCEENARPPCCQPSPERRAAAGQPSAKQRVQGVPTPTS